MKRLFVDLEICAKCEDCTVRCKHILHPINNGIVQLRETVNFLIVCRRCEDAPCIRSCPFEAIDKQKDGVLKRYSMRCVSCKSCSWACPFGTIYPETIPYLFNRCDLCLGLTGKLTPPACVTGCPHNGVRFEEIEPDPEKDLYLINDNLVVRSVHWQRNPIVIKKK